MLDYGEYSIGDNGHQGDGNGANPLSYNQLDGDWLTYYEVAKGFIKRVKREDRQDFLHDLMLVMARVKVKYNAKGKELTKGGLIRIACYEVSVYWRKWYYSNTGIDCGRCSKAQKQICKKHYLSRGCPKAIKLESLNRVIEDSDGNKVELHELLADDNATDLVARLDARLMLDGYPRRFVELAYKKVAGYRLNNTEKQYYYRELKKSQKKLLEV